MSKVALITGVTGQDGSYRQSFCWKKVTRCMVLSVVHRHSTLSAWITFIRIRTPATRNSICIMAT